MHSLEDAHLWSLMEATAARMELLHDNVVVLRMDLGQGGKVNRAELRLAPRVQDRHALMSAMVDGLNATWSAQSSISGGLRAPVLVRQVSSAFGARRHLLAEIDALSKCFPTDVTPSSEPGSILEIAATVLLVKRKAKLRVVAKCAGDALLRGDASLLSPESVHVELIYGSVE